MILFFEGAALGAGVLLVAYPLVAHAERGFEVPVARENPLIAIGDATAYVPTFVALVDVFGEVVEQAAGGLSSGHVELTALCVNAQEVAVELRAGPPAIFYL